MNDGNCVFREPKFRFTTRVVSSEGVIVRYWLWLFYDVGLFICVFNFLIFSVDERLLVVYAVFQQRVPEL